jgi:signal transduction histidine kinase
MIERRTKDKPELDEFFDGAREAQQDIGRLFEEVRHYAAPVNINPQPCNLVELIDETWKHMRLVRKKRTAELSHSHGNTRPECDACHTTLSQVFRNILENALAASKDPVEIEVKYSNEELNGEAAIRVAICDNGPGLTPEVRAQVFDAFYTTRTHGTGLGLAISKRIVEAHGGSIGVGDENSSGAEFIVILPLKK